MTHFNKDDKEMSIEEILSSIRKYVSDVEETGQQAMSSSQEEIVVKERSEDTEFIKLDKSQIIENETEETNYSKENPSDLTRQSKTGVFDKLTEALKTYGKPKQPQYDHEVYQFFKLIIKEWLDKNLPQIAEELVMREIEKLRSYGKYND
jgi:cell pole-organizing protein PopZ